MSTNNPQACPFEGSADLYGIGVRIGLYTQWAATLLVTLFNPKDEETFRIVNLIIQSSIFLGLCQQANTKTHPVEPVLTTFLLFGSLSSLTRDGIMHISHFSTVYRTLFYVALTAYNCWFWFIGLDGMRDPTCIDIAFFGRSSVHGWFRSFAKALSITGLVCSVSLVGVCAFAVRRRFRNGFLQGFVREPRRRPQVEIVLLLLSMGLIVFSIAIIEYLVRVNHITGLSDLESAGQMIPLLVGGMSGMSVLWTVLVRGSLRKKRCWLFFGWHL